MRRFLALLAALAGALCACSGGGGTASAPLPTATLAGAGTPAVFNQKISFVIDVPGAAVAAASARRRAAVTASAAAAPVATPLATTPYVSPRTASVLLTLAEVNGVSPQQAPPAIPPINVPVGCQGSSAGCTIPVANVPAALGTDRYFVQTYAAANATGNLISTGFVDVAVPVVGGKNPAIGSAAALSIGGFVANITLAPAALNFITGTPGDAGVLVQALDAGGATIVGSAQYATPITVSVLDTTNFGFGGSGSVTVNGPLQKPLTLHYGGGNSPFGTFVQATSVDGTGTTVNASPIPVNVLPPGSHPTSPPPIGVPTSSPTGGPTSNPTGGPTSSPTSNPTGGPSSSPTSSPTGQASTGPTPGQSAAPTPTPTPLPTTLRTPVPTPKPTPTPKPVQALSLYVADAQADTISEYRIVSQIAAGVIPNPAATPSRVFTFDPTLAKSSAVGGAGLSCFSAEGVSAGNGTAGVTVDPTSGTIFILPNCTDGTNGFVLGYPAGAVGAIAPTIYDPFTGGGFGEVNGLALARGTVWAGYESPNSGLYGFPVASNGHQPATVIGTACYAEFGNPSPGCFSSVQAGFGVDNNGFLYQGTYWNDTPTGDASVFSQPAAVLALSTSESGSTVSPFAAIAGLNSEVGGSSQPPFAATVDGPILYVLTGDDTLSPPQGQPVYWPGLSACPPPSAKAPINPVVDPATYTTQCADGQQHMYLAAYSLTSQLLGTSAFGTDVDLIPNFVIGGDTVGGFGCFGSIPGQLLAASGGYVYVINLTPTCSTGSSVLAPEIDVYNTNGTSGAHTDIAPVFRLPLTTGYPLAIAIGPSGTVTGGQALLRRPLSRPYRAGLYGPRRSLGTQRRKSPFLHRLQAPMQTQ